MAKSPVQRLIPWAVVGLLALTTVLVVQSDPASAQTSTTTGTSAAPTTTTSSAPTTTAAPTTTVTSQYGQADPCVTYGNSGAQYLAVQLTTPANGSSVSGTVNISGTITRLPGAPAGTISNIFSVVSAVGQQPHHWEGEGAFSFPWRSDDGFLPDVRVGLVVSSTLDNYYMHDTHCVQLNNGFPVGIMSGGAHADPYFVSQGDLMYFHTSMTGQATFLPHTALLNLRIDSNPIVTLQVTPAAWATGTGGYAWELSNAYAYRTFNSPGHHSFTFSLTLQGPGMTWTRDDAQYNTFQVLHADYPTATPTASGATMTAWATPTMHGTAYPTRPTTACYGCEGTLTPTTTGTYEAEPATNAWIDPSAIGFSSVRPLPGERVTIYVRVQNPIEAPVDGTITIFDHKPDGQSDIVLKQNMQLGSYEYEIVTAAWTPVAEGDHLVSAIFTDNSPEGKHIPDTAISKARIYVGDGQTGTPILVMSAGLINIGTLQEGETRTVPVTVTAYNQWLPAVRVLALDPSGIKVRSLTPPTDLAPGQSATYYLQVEVPPLGENQTLGSQRLIVMARAESVSSNVESLSLIVHKEGFAGLPFISAQVALVAVAGTGAATAFFRRRGGSPPV